MKPYQIITNRTFFGEDWFGKVKNVPQNKVRNKLKKHHKKNDVVLVTLYPEKSKKAIRQSTKKQIQQEFIEFYEKQK